MWVQAQLGSLSLPFHTWVEQKPARPRPEQWDTVTQAWPCLQDLSPAGAALLAHRPEWTSQGRWGAGGGSGSVPGHHPAEQRPGPAEGGHPLARSREVCRTGPQRPVCRLGDWRVWGWG